MQSEVKNIVELLKKQNVIGSKLFITCKVGHLQFNIINKDILGGVIQDWFAEWLIYNKIYWKPPSNTQAYPDFTLKNDQSLELKTYNHSASPAFDIGNFKSLVDDLILNPKRLDTDYLIFSYSENSDKSFSIKQYWCKKIWEITCVPLKFKSSASYGLITSQIKRGTIVNLRPFNFNKHLNQSFNSRGQFVTQLKITIEKFKFQLIKNDTNYKNSEDWYQKVKNNYEKQTNTRL
jgi:hypothetical protein